MITFISGLPGFGKTLFTIDYVRNYVEQEYQDALQKAIDKGEDPNTVEKRVVYQSGISDLKLPWLTLEEPESWHTLPEHSIIIIDECQRVFPAMPNGAKRPKHYTELDTHRHSGYDLFLITQDPVNADIRPRSMSERHFHLSRSYGLERSTLYEWQSVQLVSGGRYKNIEGGIKKEWKFPKDVYNLYKSAEVHTHKKRLPIKKLVMSAVPIFGILVMIYLGSVNIFRHNDSEGVNTSLTASDSILPDLIKPDSIKSDTIIARGAPLPTIANLEPILENKILTVPMFSHLVQVKSYRRIAGCMSMKIGRVNTCECADQRGNEIEVDLETCMAFITDGEFDYSLTDDEYNQQIQPQQNRELQNDENNANTISNDQF